MEAGLQVGWPSECCIWIRREVGGVHSSLTMGIDRSQVLTIYKTEISYPSCPLSPHDPSHLPKQTWIPSPNSSSSPTKPIQSAPPQPPLPPPNPILPQHLSSSTKNPSPPPSKEPKPFSLVKCPNSNQLELLLVEKSKGWVRYLPRHPLPMQGS